MIVKMKSGSQYIISDGRGKLLEQLLQKGTDKEFINLDGNGMMVKTSLIEKIFPDNSNPTTEAWKEAIRENLRIMRQTGHMGTLTAQDILNPSAVATG